MAAQPSISFTELVQKLSTDKPPLQGAVPTYVYIEHSLAKQLALTHIKLDTLQNEIREVRTLLGTLLANTKYPPDI